MCSTKLSPQVDDDKKLVLTKTLAGCLGVTLTMTDEADVMLDSCSDTASLAAARNVIELYRSNNNLAIKVRGFEVGGRGSRGGEGGMGRWGPGRVLPIKL